MTARFSIFVTEYGADREVELCQLDGNPDPMLAGLKAKTLMVYDGKKKRRTKMSKYVNIRVVDHAASP